MMTQLSSKSDSDTVKKILSNLRVQIVKGKRNDKSIEKQQSLNWQQFLSDLTNEKNTLLDQNIQYLNHIKFRVQKQNQIRQEMILKEQNNLERQDQQFRQQEGIYQMESQSRIQSQDLISRIQDHTQERLQLN